jgi:hypothetical protein
MKQRYKSETYVLFVMERTIAFYLVIRPLLFLFLRAIELTSRYVLDWSKMQAFEIKCAIDQWWTADDKIHKNSAIKWASENSWIFPIGKLVNQ